MSALEKAPAEGRPTVRSNSEMTSGAANQSAGRRQHVDAPKTSAVGQRRGSQRLQRKRSSVQSNLSSLNGGGGGGGGGSLHSSSSTMTSDEGEPAAERSAQLSSADYEHVRNATLLFFLDRLYLASQEGKEARTLHELSCLFGTKEFTKEMRQIVGASRNGLKKFLASYPSLFHIDGDKVHLSQLQPDPASPKRDYNREAVDYFRLKLLQFGASLVPIKNLFGYRSQATQEVRHVSGKSARDFKRFLRHNDDVFEVLADEHVMLKSALAELESRGHTSLSLELSLQQLQGPDDAIVTDPYLNKQFASLVEDCVRQMAAEAETEADQHPDHFKTSLEQLHERIQTHCRNELFLKMVKSRDDLQVFLRMHPKLFKRFRDPDDQRDYVQLLSEAERRELEAAAAAAAAARQQQSLVRQHSTLGLAEVGAGATGPKTALRPSVSSGLESGPRSLAVQPSSCQQKSPPAATQTPTTTTTTTTSNNNINNNNNKLASQQLRATAPPFVPTGRPPQRQNSSLASGPARASSRVHSEALKQRSHSNLTRGEEPHAARRDYPQLRDSVNWPAGRAPLAEPVGQCRALPASGSELRARTVNIVREASTIITRIMSTADAVAFDCKGYNLGFDGQITLIQFGYLPRAAPKTTTNNNHNNHNDGQHKETPAAKPEVCVFDLITNPELAYCLKPLLESERIVKIVHDVRNKSNALHAQFDIILSNVFDTQVANLVIQQQDTGKPAYKSRYISMGKLCEIYGTDELMRHRNLIKIKTRHSSMASSSAGAPSTSASSSKDVNYWRARPLTKPMIFEATMDVYCLVGGIYQNLRAKLKPEYEPLFEQLNLEGVLARIRPDEIKSVKKERKIDLEVIDLKRKLYTDSTGQVVLSNREIRLLRHVDLTPEVRDKIQQCKKVAKKIERLDLKAAQLKQALEGNDNSISPTNSELSSMNTATSTTTATNNNNNSNSVSQEHRHSSSTDCSSVKNTSGAHEALAESAALADQLDELHDTGVLMSSLMDSSMFDELKDKMIESSSLLESLDDDDDDEQHLKHHHHHHQHHNHHHHPHLNHSHSHNNNNNNEHTCKDQSAPNLSLSSHADCCRCQCHRSCSLEHNAASEQHSSPQQSLESPAQEVGVVTGANGTKSAPEVDIQPQVADGEGKSSEAQVKDKEGDSGRSEEKASSLACDMAVQCDLLS